MSSSSKRRRRRNRCEGGGERRQPVGRASRLPFPASRRKHGVSTFWAGQRPEKSQPGPSEERASARRSHGWSLEGIPLLELSAIETLLRPESQTTVFHPSEMELTKVTGLLLAEAEKARPMRVVFDSLSEFRLIADAPLR